MKKLYILIYVGVLLIVLAGCGKSDFYGEYSIDGKPRYNIKIMNDDTANVVIDGQVMNVGYKKNGDRLEVNEDDVYNLYADGITNVFFKLKDSNTLSYYVVENGHTIKIGEYKRIPGSDGDSGHPSVFWMTLKYMFYGVIIYLIMYFVMRLIIKPV
jgi:hypothetical protein